MPVSPSLSKTEGRGFQFGFSPENISRNVAQSRDVVQGPGVQFSKRGEEEGRRDEEKGKKNK